MAIYTSRNAFSCHWHQHRCDNKNNRDAFNFLHHNLGRLMHSAEKYNSTAFEIAMQPQFILQNVNHEKNEAWGKFHEAMMTRQTADLVLNIIRQQETMRMELAIPNGLHNHRVPRFLGGSEWDPDFGSRAWYGDVDHENDKDHHALSIFALSESKATNVYRD